MFPNILYTLLKYKDEDVFQSLKIFFFLDFGIASVSGGFKGLIFTKFFTNSVENEKVGRDFISLVTSLGLFRFR